MRILLAEDELTLVRQIKQDLTDQGYAVDVANNGEDALHAALNEPYDLIVLDLGLPKIDGITVLKKVRQALISVPIIILTARDSWNDKVAGIDAGADDYVSKPFHIQELLARIRALIRRSSGLANPVLSCGGLSLDTRSGHVLKGTQEVNLTSHEYKLLDFLMHHVDEIISRQTLTEHIYAQDFDRDSNTIDVFIGRLRKKLGDHNIETVRGSGYRLIAPKQ